MWSVKVFNDSKTKLLRLDPSLKKLFKRHKSPFFELPKKRSTYESLMRAIAHQQLHGKAAETILSRFIALTPGKAFPQAEEVLKLSRLQLRKCGFSESKVKFLKDIALYASRNKIPEGKVLAKLSNQELIEKLIKIYGVGKWTVQMMLIFKLGRRDVWPVDDFGIRKGFQIFKGLKEMPKPKDLKSYGELCEPYQSIVALYLWKEADLSKKTK